MELRPQAREGVGPRDEVEAEVRPNPEDRSALPRLGGEDVSKFTRDELADVRNRRVGFVFQGFNLLPQITAFENVEMLLLFGGVPPKKRREREVVDTRNATKGISSEKIVKI